MAQGVVKSRKPPTSSSSRKSSNPKKGQRTIAPKKKNLVQGKGITKKYTAGLIGKTERKLAEKAGHLEMLRGGKKGKEEKKGKGGAAGKGKEGGK